MKNRRTDDFQKPIRKKALRDIPVNKNKLVFELIFPLIMLDFAKYYNPFYNNDLASPIKYAQSLLCTCKAMAGYEKLIKIKNDLKILYLNVKEYHFKTIDYGNKSFISFKYSNKILMFDFASLISFINEYCKAPLSTPMEVHVHWKLPGEKGSKKHFMLLHPETFKSFKKTTLIGRLKFMGETAPNEVQFYLEGNYHTAYSWFLSCVENSRKRASINNRLALFVKTWFVEWPWQLPDPKISVNKILF